MGTQIGRGIEQEPGNAVGADGNLQLGAGLAAKRAFATGSAVAAGAIPLRETTACSRSQDFDLHPAWLDFRAGVGIDLTAEGDLFAFRLSPLHTTMSLRLGPIVVKVKRVATRPIGSVMRLGAVRACSRDRW